MGTRVGGEPGYRTTHVSRTTRGKFYNHTGNILVGKYRVVWLFRIGLLLLVGHFWLLQRAVSLAA